MEESLQIVVLLQASFIVMRVAFKTHLSVRGKEH